VIAKVSRGADGTGLARYLFGPGKENEHQDQRVIAASDGLEVDHGRALNREEMLDLGHQLDAPHAMFGTEVADGHIWHLSLTNPAGDRTLSDQEWSKIAHDTMDRLGFTEAPGRAGCPWVAIGHGLSTAGNEHVHIAVSLVREDGSKASIWQDRVKLSEACSTFERDYGLTVVDGRTRESVPGVSRAEDEIAARRGRAEPERDTLARNVRAASVASRDESEFVRRLKVEGIIVRPRYEQGSTERIAGYSVALKPAAGQEPVFYGGGRLAKDLSLPKLRERWQDHSPAVDHRETAVRDPSYWAKAADRTAGVRRHLELVPASDTARWAGAAHETSGVLAELSARLEPHRPGDLAKASDLLARPGQAARSTRGVDVRTVVEGPVSDLRGVATVAGQTRGTSQDVARLTAELGQTADAVAAAHAARGELHAASQLHAAAGNVAVLAAKWAAVQRMLPDSKLIEKAIAGEAGRSPDEEGEPERRRQRSGPDRDRGFGW